MMKAIFSDQLSEFSKIYSNDIELVSIKRPDAESCNSLSKKFIASKQELKLQWTQNTEDSKHIVNAIPETIQPDLRSMLIEQISESSTTLHELVGCKKVAVRIATLRSAMCPRFHVDQIPCRLLITFCGKATEWIPNDSVDWDIFSDSSSNDIPVEKEEMIQKLKPGEWALLKGGKWQNNFRGVVHRSPHDKSERLFLSIDPIFEDL